MRKKIWIRIALGFAFGVGMVLLIPALFNRVDGRVQLVSANLADAVGGETAALLLSMLLYGLYGTLCMGGTLLYEIERWPIALATAVHYAFVIGPYPLMSKLLCWNLSLKLLLVIEGLMTVGFFLIWLILYLRCRAEVRELNRLLEKNRKP